MTAGVNRAIRETHINGVVTSTTLMANGTAFQDAIEFVHAVPSISVGCHVVLVDGDPVSARESIPTLLSTRGGHAGRFYSGISSVAARTVLQRFDPDQLISEIVGQVKMIQSADVQVTHLDTHKHTHLFPQILTAVVQAARITGVPAVRNPFTRDYFARALICSKAQVVKRYSQVRMLNIFAAVQGKG